MKTAERASSINIRPGARILSVLRHLNYKPWFAIAEFVDNALQSFLDYREQLRQLEGEGVKLKVSIEIETSDEGRITVRDNAAGIHEEAYARAFRPAEIPPDRSGLSEFGMGMKSAACWLAPRWTVRTSALGEPIERTVSFDIEAIVRDDLEELTVETRPISADVHFTEIILYSPHKLPQGRTIRKIKEHLASIYRVFTREGFLSLHFDNEQLNYPEPRILSAPYHKSENEPPRIWRKEISFDFGLGLKAQGFAAIRETASTSSAGFALFRRKRLIQGSADEGYRPEYIFGKSNSFIYQRLFGELELEGFEVSHTKDGFRWDENEEIFLQFLKDNLKEEPLLILDQAANYRVRPKPAELKAGAEAAVQNTAEVIRREVPPILERQIEALPETQPPPVTLPPVTTSSSREITVEMSGCLWRIAIELSSDPGVSDWITISDQLPSEADRGTCLEARRLNIRLSLAHPFMDKFGGTEPEVIEPLLRVAAAICLAETSARESGVRGAGTIRKNINELLRNALCKS